jgi:hypothetical protein
MNTQPNNNAGECSPASPCSASFIEEAIDGLQYICDSPPKEYGGFHENAIQTAKDAVQAIEYLKGIAIAANEILPSVNELVDASRDVLEMMSREPGGKDMNDIARVFGRLYCALEPFSDSPNTCDQGHSPAKENL